MSNPLFSVIVPTRNRASLLRESLPTFLEINCADCEIIISDNNSSDDTQAVVASFLGQDPRLKYVHSGRDLSMVGSYEFGLNAARGEYLVFGSDDDAFVPQCLKLSQGLIEKFGMLSLLWGHATYMHPDVPGFGGLSKYWGKAGSGRLYEIPATVAIEAWNDWRYMELSNLYPKILKCVIHRSVIQKAAKLTRNFFIPPFPDSSGACQVIANVDSYWFLDLPFYLGGCSIKSNSGIVYNRVPVFDNYVNLFERDLLAKCKYPMRYTCSAYWLATQEIFQELYPDRFGRETNFRRYFESCFEELQSYRLYDNITQELSQLKSYMNEHFGDDSAFDALCARPLKPPGGEDPAVHDGPLKKLVRIAYRRMKAFALRNQRIQGTANAMVEASRAVGRTAASKGILPEQVQPTTIRSVEEMAQLSRMAALG